MIKTRCEPAPGKDGSEAVLDGYRRLLNAILLQAVFDASQNEDIPAKIESLLWLAGPEAQEIGGYCGVDPWLAYVTKRTKVQRRLKRTGANGWRVE